MVRWLQEYLKEKLKWRKREGRELEEEDLGESAADGLKKGSFGNGGDAD